MKQTGFAERPRLLLLDELRGLWVLFMVAYHGAYDLVYLFDSGFPYPLWDGMRRWFQPLIACGFIVMSGISCRYSRGNLKRGAITLGFGMVVSISTLVVMPDQMIWFGILHFLGCAMMLFALVRPLLDKIPPLAGLFVCAALFVFTRGLPDGSVGLPGLIQIPLRLEWYLHPWLLPLGFGGAGADYFPLLPWLFLYLAGACLGRIIFAANLPGWMYRSRAAFLSQIGRRAILIYMVHQPVLYGLLWLVYR